MNLPISALTMASALALAACGQGDVELKNASVEEVAKATAETQQLKPGQWKSTVQIVSADIPGLPPGAGAMKDQMVKSMTGRQTANEYCVTPEEAKKATADMLSGDKSGNCQFERYTIADGKLDAVMVCKPAQGGEMKVQMGGPFTSDGYSLDSTMQIATPDIPGGKPMTIKTKVTGERTGACKA